MANLVVTPLCVFTGFVDFFPVVFTWFVEIFSGVVPTCLGCFGRVWLWVFVDFFLLVLLQRGLLWSLKIFFFQVLLRGLWVLETFSSWYCYGVCRIFSGVVTTYLVRVLGKWFLVLLQRVLDPTGVKSIIPAVCWNRVFEVLPGIQSRVL